MSELYLRNSPFTCEHDNLERLAEGVHWCPDCGSQFAVTREDIERVRALFLQKLAEKYPDHPWTKAAQAGGRGRRDA